MSKSEVPSLELESFLGARALVTLRIGEEFMEADLKLDHLLCDVKTREDAEKRLLALAQHFKEDLTTLRIIPAAKG